ncbi:MAG: helix-turn-helix transcriptional regulator [Gammaproteobacteria bacterium]
MMIQSDIVRDHRTQRGWTQQQLAELADLSLRTVQRIESQGVASNESVSALSAVLEVPREILLAPAAPPERAARAERSLLWLTVLAASGGAVIGTLLTLAATGVLGGG